MIVLASGSSSSSSVFVIIVYIVIIIAFMYFIAIRPQRKRDKKKKELLSNVEVGDSILTTSGFYGMVIDVADDTVIVEFGGNKNCRIPMQKEAIVDIEKANEEEAAVSK